AVTQAQVAQLYVALFNRAPEGAGFNAWVNAGANTTIARMANDMLSSPAAVAYFNGSIDHDRDFVEMLYKNILGKDYSQDPDGINAWVKHLQLGNSRGDTVAKLFEVATSAIAKAADPVAAKVFENKTAISQYMAEKIADIPADQSGAYDYSLFQDIIATTNNTNLDEQKAKIDALIAPTIHNLSASANDVSGTDKSDVFNGAVSATVGQTTFKATDKLDGKGGNDTLNLDLYTNFYGMTIGTGEVKNIENLNLTNKSNGDLRFDTKYIHNMESITLNGENKIDIINPENKVKLLINDLKLSGNTDSGRLNLIYNTDVLAGSNDNQEIVVNNVNMDKDARINITTVNGDHIEALTINAVGGASKLTKFTSNTTRQPDQVASIKTMHIKGTADLTVNTTDGLYSFDASEYKGNKLVANVIANGYVQSIKGSEQDDVFNVTGANGSIIPINGGAGKDTVNFIDAIYGNQHVEMTGVEVLNINTSASVLDFTRAQEITELGINGSYANVNILNSKIAKVNAKATSSTYVTINNSTDIKDFVIEKGNSGSITANGTESLNVKVANDSALPASQGTSSVYVSSNTIKELNFTLENTTTTGGGFYSTINDAVALETLNVVNKTGNYISASINASNASGSHNTNAYNLKTLNVETKGNYTLSNKLSGISKINLKGTGDDTSVTLGTLGDKTYLPVPLQGVQDITLNAEGLKDLVVAQGDYIYTTRDVNLTYTTDKKDGGVVYGNIGLKDGPNAYAVNNVNINANGQKTLNVAAINAAGDVNLTTHFTQKGSTADYGNNTSSYVIGRNVTLNHTSKADLTDGEVKVNGTVKATGNLDVTASGYKVLQLGSGSSDIAVGGSANIKTVATVAQSTTNIKGIVGATKGLAVSASAASGVTDAVLTYGDLSASAKDVSVNVSNQKSVTIGDVSASGTTAATRGDVNITTTTSIQDALVKVGNVSSSAKDVTLKFIGQERLEVGAISAEDPSTGVKNFGKVNVDVRTNDNDATATFGAISGTSVNLNVNNLKSLTVGGVMATYGDVMISTGTNTYLETASFTSVSGKNVTMDVANVTAPIIGTTYIQVHNNLTIKGYAGDAVSEYGINISNWATNTDDVNFVANLTNVKGSITSGNYGEQVKTLTIKGGVTNPSSLKSAGQNSDLSIDTNGLMGLKTIDLSGYTNASGKTALSTGSDNISLTTIKGATTATEIEVNSEGLKSIETAAGNDKVTINVAQTNDINISLGAGDDYIEFAIGAELTSGKKFVISGGAGKDTFNLAEAKTDATASKYVTISDIGRGDKIDLGTATAFAKYTATDLDSEASLLAAANKVLTSAAANAANKVWAFSYGNETYLVRDNDGLSTGLSADDNLV
ncbi:DUF4214 domain-containing protein, partial [uncultured Campylobacter sp.]|uniref:DUF4214 domain-containing protein n=1 Tax=uncultured Campylobacter sp. TaxID=218934 RepID=UPI0026207AE6